MYEKQKTKTYIVQNYIIKFAACRERHLSLEFGPLHISSLKRNDCRYRKVPIYLYLTKISTNILNKI